MSDQPPFPPRTSPCTASSPTSPSGSSRAAARPGPPTCPASPRPPPSAVAAPPAPTSAAATSPTPWRPAAAPTAWRCAGGSAVSLGIVTSYNDMLSAHAPYETYPQLIKETAARDRRRRPGRGRRAGHVRRHHPGPGGHGASLFSRDVIAMSDGDRPVPRRLRRRADARRLRQDRARPRRRCPRFGHLPDGARPGRPDVLGPAEQREGRGPPRARRRQGRPRGAAGRRGRVLPLARAPARSTAPPTPTSC